MRTAKQRMNGARRLSWLLFLLLQAARILPTHLSAASNAPVRFYDGTDASDFGSGSYVSPRRGTEVFDLALVDLDGDGGREIVVTGQRTLCSSEIVHQGAVFTYSAASALFAERAYGDGGGPGFFGLPMVPYQFEPLARPGSALPDLV